MKLFSSLAIFRLASGQQICGNYCGPGWCNGKALRERNCDDSAEPTSPADACCMMHDDCCGHAKDTSSCNKMLVQCLSKQSPGDLSCTRALPFIPFPTPVSPMVIEKTIGVVEDWCCGKPCPKEQVVREPAKHEAENNHQGVLQDAEDIDLIDEGLQTKMEWAPVDAASHEQSGRLNAKKDWVPVGAAAAFLATVVAVVTLAVKQRQTHQGDYISLDLSQD